VLNSGDTGTAATMIDLPETTIYVIGDYGDVDFISQDAFSPFNMTSDLQLFSLIYN
jgi:hypothetical protein